MDLLFFDTETTGMCLWKERSSDKKQPHIVQLAALLVDEHSKEVKESMDVIVKPDGWEIPKEMSDIHGITQERALEEGIPEIEALRQFLYLWNQCDLRVSHNTTFDNRIIRIALKRYMRHLIKDDVWKDKTKYYCTLQNSKKIMGGKDGHKLEQCYRYFLDEELENGHNAMVDAQACMEIYYAIQDQQFESEMHF